MESDREGGTASDEVVKEGLSEEMTSELRPGEEEGAAMHSENPRQQGQHGQRP